MTRNDCGYFQVTQRHNGGHQEEDASHEGGEGQCHGQG